MVGFKAWVLLVSGMAGLLALFLFGPLLFLAENIYAATPVWPGSAWQEQKPSQLGMDEADLNKARDYALQKGGGSGMIISNGYIVMKWGDQGKRYDIKSSTKSIGVTILGLALKDEKINLSDQAQKRLSTVGVPPDSNKNTGWLDDITILHLATRTAGFEKTGGLGEILFEPGEEWSYSDGGPNWLADVLTVTYGEDLGILLCDRVLEPIGVDCLDDIPSLDIVAVRAGDAWRSSDGQDPYEVLEPFLQHIAASVQ